MARQTKKSSSPLPHPPDSANVDLSGLSAAERDAYAAALAEPTRNLYWKPEREGEYVLGVLERVKLSERLEEKTGELKEERAAIIRRDDGSTIRVGMLAVLLRAFHEQDVRDGSRLLIVYRGEGTAKPRQSPPKFFKVRVLDQGSGGVALGSWAPPEPTDEKPRVVRRKRAAKKGAKS